MRIVCYKCQREIGEKVPFSDSRITSMLCELCLKETLKNLGRYRPSGKNRWRLDPEDTSLPEV